MRTWRQGHTDTCSGTWDMGAQDVGRMDMRCGMWGHKMQDERRCEQNTAKHGQN